MSKALLIRRRGMMKAAAAPTHVKLQYITTTGAQSAITDLIVPTTNTVMKVVAVVKDRLTTSVSRMIISSGNGITSAYQLYSNSTRFYLNSAAITKNTTSFYTITATRNPSTNIDNINGATATGNGRDIAGHNIVLSSSYSGSNKSNGQDAMSIQVYFDNVLVADFIPVRIGTVAQWYDQLNNKYWPSQTGTDYVAGPDL